LPRLYTKHYANLKIEDHDYFQGRINRGLSPITCPRLLRTAANKDDRLSRWALKLTIRRHHNVASVALANKMTRVAWAMMKNETTYNANMAAA
ncbi:MAG: hypothetical protein ACK5VR_05560, partial [Burkholderiales bacterium]